MSLSSSRSLTLLLTFLCALNARTQTISSDVGTTICKGQTVVMTGHTYYSWYRSTDGGSSWNMVSRGYTYATAAIQNGYQFKGEYYDVSSDNNLLTPPVTFVVNGEQVGVNTVSSASRGTATYNGTDQAFLMTPGFSVGSDPFTFDSWFRLNDVPSTDEDPSMFTLIGAGSGGDRPVSIMLANATTVRFQSFGCCSLDFTVPKLTVGTWYHLALVRDGAYNMTVYVNGSRSSTGIQQNIPSASSNLNVNTGIIRYIGRNPDGNRFNGQMTNLRVVAGTALYDPTQVTITVPTSPLANVTNTKILLLTNSEATKASDASGNQTLTTDVAAPGWQANSPFRETVSGARTLSNTVAGGSWSSSNTSVATVDASTGVIAAVANGNADITYTITSGGCTSTAVTPIAVSLPCTTNSWSGGTGNWNVAGNWSCGSVPDGSTDIAVSSGTPTLDVDFTLPSGRSLTLSGSGSLVVAAGKTLTVAGTADFGGRPVTLKSTASGDAAIGQVTGTLSNASQVTVERYIATAKRAWRLLGIPLSGSRTLREQWAGVAANATAPTGETAGSGTLLTGHQYANGSTASAAGFDWYTGMTATSTSSIRFYSHDGTNGSFASATNTPGVTTTPAKQGYMLFVRGDRTVTTGSGTTTLKPSGTLLTGTRSVTVSQAYEVVGNPYAATLDADQVYLNSGNSSVIQRNFWVWDATLGTAGGFRAISYGVSSYAMTGGSGTATDYLKIRSGNAFFVQKNGSGGSLSIEENDKVDGSSAPVVLGTQEAAEPEGVLSVNLLDTGRRVVDGIALRYGSGYAASPLESFDMPKLNNFNENMGLVRAGRYLSIESRPWPTAHDTAFLAAWNLPMGRHLLSVETRNMSAPGLDATLLDAYTGQSTPIDLSGTRTDIPFQVSSDTLSRSLFRFSIVLRGAARTGGQTPVVGQPSLRIVPNPSHGGRIGLQWTNLPPGDYTVSLRSVNGSLLLHQRRMEVESTATQGVIDLDRGVSRLTPGLYILTIEDGKGMSWTVKGWHQD